MAFFIYLFIFFFFDFCIVIFTNISGMYLFNGAKTHKLSYFFNFFFIFRLFILCFTSVCMWFSCILWICNYSFLQYLQSLIALYRASLFNNLSNVNFTIYVCII